MGTVLEFDQAHWSTMRMVQDAKKWCEERDRAASADEHRRTLKSLISAVTDRVA